MWLLYEEAIFMAQQQYRSHFSSDALDRLSPLVSRL
jgi:hypothetical protein